ncbi:UNVERIFIED_CONTAM: hypothetical protein K2H54_057896 [Gekko kuhli]
MELHLGWPWPPKSRRCLPSEVTGQAGEGWPGSAEAPTESSEEEDAATSSHLVELLRQSLACLHKRSVVRGNSIEALVDSEVVDSEETVVGLRLLRRQEGAPPPATLSSSSALVALPALRGRPYCCQQLHHAHHKVSLLQRQCRTNRLLLPYPTGRNQYKGRAERGRGSQHLTLPYERTGPASTGGLAMVLGWSCWRPVHSPRPSS